MQPASAILQSHHTKYFKTLALHLRLKACTATYHTKLHLSQCTTSLLPAAGPLHILLTMRSCTHSHASGQSAFTSSSSMPGCAFVAQSPPTAIRLEVIDPHLRA